MTSTRRSSLRRRVAVAVGVLALLISAQARAAGPTITFETAEDAPASGAWIGGAPPFNVIAAGPRGVRSIRVAIDGRLEEEQVFRCYYEYPYVQPPCESPHTVGFALATPSYGDGVHTAVAEAVDSDGVTSAASVPLRFDNTAPAPPSNPLVDGGVGWRSQPEWRISWTNPEQRFAPLGAVRYLLCPSAADSSDPRAAADAKAACVYGEYAAPDLKASWVPAARRHDLTRLPEPFRLPKPGLWTLRVWLVDAAVASSCDMAEGFVCGNSNPDAPMVISGLGYDPTPPLVTGFASQDPSDPARVFVGASEDVSPLTGGSVEVQRYGSKVWRPLGTEVRSGGVTAFVDDETLRRGRYRLRATVTNAAGLQQSTDRGTDGQVKTLRLPIRVPSRLHAGRRVGKVCRGSGNRRRCRWRLARRVTVPLGLRITLRARLTVGGRPVKHQPLELWQRESVAGAKWQRLGAVQTNARGRVRYKARKGVARKLRFRYPGTPHVRGDNGTVALRVQAKTTLRVSRRRVVNGEYVTFRGRLKGRRRPPAGLLVELQVRSRGRWRTFAQPRTDAAGSWQYQYRFETVRASARFRFRARVRQQVGYPFATGSSRTIGVRVHGL